MVIEPQRTRFDQRRGPRRWLVDSLRLVRGKLFTATIVFTLALCLYATLITSAQTVPPTISSQNLAVETKESAYNTSNCTASTNGAHDSFWVSDTATLAFNLAPLLLGIIVRTVEGHGDLFSCIRPALAPTYDTAAQLGLDTYPDNAVRPFFEISIRRLRLASLLSFLGLSLASTSLSLARQGNVGAASSMLVYSLGFMHMYYFVFREGLPFSWANSLGAKFSVIILTIWTIAAATVDPNSMDFFRIINPIYPTIWYVVIFLCAYMIMRIVVVRRFPSLRGILLQGLNKKPDGLTLDLWLEYIDSTGLSASKEEIKSSLEGLVYQGKARLKVTGDESSLRIAHKNKLEFVYQKETRIYSRYEAMCTRC